MIANLAPIVTDPVLTIGAPLPTIAGMASLAASLVGLLVACVVAIVAGSVRLPVRRVRPRPPVVALGADAPVRKVA